MASYFSITMVVLAAFFGASTAGIVPAAVAAPAPLVAAAPAALAAAPIAAAPVFGYAKAVPHNIPPHASRIDISTRNLAAPYVAAPAFAPAVAPAVAPAHLAYSPYVYAGSLAAPLVQAPEWI